jgi:hypothetical protein
VFHPTHGSPFSAQNCCTQLNLAVACQGKTLGLLSHL